MRIEKTTIKSLADKGIRVNFHPESDEEYRKKVWQKDYDYAYNYDKGMEVFVDGKFRKISLDELEQHAREFADSVNERHTHNWYDADTLYIRYGDKGRMVVQKVSVKSKEITEDYVLKLIEKNEKMYKGFYGEFTDKMNNLLGNKKSYFSIYPTTYGIGVWLFYNFTADKDIKYIENILKEKGIEYYNEFSDMRYVYRFKISKKRENLERL